MTAIVRQRTLEILDGYAPYRFTDDELSEAIYWAEAKWTACRASIDALNLSPKKGPHAWEPINPEYLAWDASQMLCDILGPIEVYVRSTGQRLKGVA